MINKILLWTDDKALWTNVRRGWTNEIGQCGDHSGKRADVFSRDKEFRLFPGQESSLLSIEQGNRTGSQKMGTYRGATR